MYNLPASIPMKFFSPKRLPLTKHVSIMAHNKISIYHRIMTVTPYWKSITMCHNWNSFTQNLLHGITFLSGSSVLISLHHNFNLFFMFFYSRDFFVTSHGLHSHTPSQCQSVSILPPSGSGSGINSRSRSQERKLLGVTTDCV